MTFPPLPQPKLVLDLATPEGCKAELTWVVVISQDRLPAKYGQTGSVVAGIRTCDRESQVQRPNHCTTEPPWDYLRVAYLNAFTQYLNIEVQVNAIVSKDTLMPTEIKI